jgi:hypothetical protein
LIRLSSDLWTGLWERGKNGTKRKVWEDVLSPPKSRLKWMDEFCRQKGVEHALDHICDSLNFVAVGIYWWLCGWWTHSYPAGHRHHRLSGPTYSGTKNIVAIWTLAGEGEVFGKEVVNRSRKILPKFTIPSVEKVSQPAISPQTYREE